MKVTRPHHQVRFEKDEPFCVIVPKRRHELDTFRPQIRSICSNAESAEEFDVSVNNREQMEIKRLASAHVPELASYKIDWERHYYKGQTPGTRPAPEHQVKRQLAEFTHSDD